MALSDFKTPHTAENNQPQTYCQHFSVAFCGSLRLIGLGFGGIWHAFFPEHKGFQFWTSSGIIRIYRELEKSGRHDDEIGEIFTQNRRNYVENHRGE